MPFVALDQLTPTRVQWLWPGRLALGHLAIFDGDPGLGKSLVTLDLCARITTGAPFPDGAAGTEKAPVIVINAEDGARDTIHGRLRAAGADLSRVHVFERAAGEAFLRLPKQLARLEDVVSRTGARYVVLDPVTSFLDGDVNLASDQRVRAALAPLADLADRRRCVIQLVRHLNKGGGFKALYRGLYSIGFIAACRLSWLVGRDPDLAGRYVLSQPKSNLDPPQPSLGYSIEPDAGGTARLAWHGTSPWSADDVLAAQPGRLHLRQRAQEFLKEFLRGGPRTARAIWEASRPLRISSRTLARARKQLNIRSVQAHVCTPQQTNYWLLPDQELPKDAGIDQATIDMDKFFREQEKLFPRRTPLEQPRRK